MDTQAVIIAVLAAVGGGAVAAFINGYFQGPKTKAEAAKLIAEQGQTIDGRWEKLNDELEGRLAAERQEHKDKLDEFRRLAEEETQRNAEAVQALTERVSGLEAKLNASEGRVADLRSALSESEAKVGRLRRDLNAEKAVTRQVVAWAVAMRAEILRLGGEVPDVPQRVEDYINAMDPTDR